MPRSDKGCTRPHLHTDVLERIYSHCVANEVTGCIEWVGALSTQGGYPITLDYDEKGKRVYLYCHRVVWQEVNEQAIPEGPADDGSYRWEIDHTCNNRRCLAENHLECVPHNEHMRRHAERRRVIKAAKEGKAA
jgi:hypothetical protein